MKKVISIALCLIMAYVLFHMLDMSGVFRYKVVHETKIDEVNPDTGEFLYRIKFYHWYHFAIVRFKSYSDQTESQIDSLITIENNIGKKINSKIK